MHFLRTDHKVKYKEQVSYAAVVNKLALSFHQQSLL